MKQYIERKLSQSILKMARKMPVITLTGPRQSGKTTLARSLFSQHTYVSLENPDMKAFAEEDPRGFLDYSGKGLIIDEAQNVPRLFSYLQGLADEGKKMGAYVLTGSQNFLLLEKISQSLAGRSALFFLLPFSLEELKGADAQPQDPWELIFKGFYPPLHDRRLKPAEWYPAYVQTYLERDVRRISQITDLHTFQLFMRLCAARTGQVVNFSALAHELGVSYQTVKHWISVLEASFTFFTLPPYFVNYGKRLVKSPKLYFFDTGLVCYLLGIRSARELKSHYLRGPLFENFVIAEIMKNLYNRAHSPQVYFWRDNHGNEVDCLYQGEKGLRSIEIKSGKTATPDQLRGLEFWQKTSGAKLRDCALVFGGNESFRLNQMQVLPWPEIANLY